MILRELVTKLGFELDDKNLRKFEQSIDEAKTKLADFGKALSVIKIGVTAVVGAATGLTILALSTAKAASETDKLAEKLNITTDDLQSLELIAQSSGLSVNELSKSFSSFNDNLGKLDTTNKGVVNDLALLSVSTKDQNGNLKSSFSLYQEAARKISTLKDPIKQAALSQRLLGTSNKDVLKIFDMTNESFEKQREEIARLGYVIDSKGIQSSKDFIKSWSNLKIIIDGVKKELSVKFMPVFSDAISMFKDWYVANRKIISQGISTFIKGVSVAFNLLVTVMGYILAPIKSIINVLGGLETTISVLAYTLGLLMIPRVLAAAAAVRVLTIALLANPVTWVTAAIIALSVAIALIIDDLVNWATGNKSLIADLLKDWFGFEMTFEEVIDNVVDYFKTSFESLAKWFSSLFDGILGTIKSVSDFVGSGVDAVREKTIFRKIIDQDKKIKPTINEEEKILRKIELVDENNLNDEPRILRKIELVDESNLNDEPRILRKIELVDESNLNDNDAQNRLQPLINPNSSLNGISPVSGNSTSNKVNQYITENVTVNVPVGTTAEQSSVIAAQVTDIFQEQFNYNILKGLDSLSSR